jgi:RNA polymerase sigma-70 factor, ECF subfamily
VHEAGGTIGVFRHAVNGDELDNDYFAHGTRTLQKGKTNRVLTKSFAKGANALDEAGFESLIAELRPRLHRYCARMTGSVIDGEDVLQEALVKALAALPRAETVANPTAWLFRIAHNTALDFLRRTSRYELASDEVLATVPDPTDVVADRQVVEAGLGTCMRLPVLQRSTVILKDVLGYSVEETSAIIDGTVPSVKSALQRGRDQLRKFTQEPEEASVPALPEPEARRLAYYIDRFNARDFDAVRVMLAEDVRLDLVNRLQWQGKKKVGEYFTGYEGAHHWYFAAGSVEGRSAILVLDPNDHAKPPNYFVLLDWRDDKIVAIRDFLYASYAMDGAEIAFG